MEFSDLGNEAFIVWEGDSTFDDEIYLTNIDYAKADDDKNRMNNNENGNTKRNTTLNTI